jgi:hypothetical protein
VFAGGCALCGKQLGFGRISIVMRPNMGRIGGFWPVFRPLSRQYLDA